MQLHEMFRDRQSEAETEFAACMRRVFLTEPLEDMGKKVARDALSSVLHEDVQRAVNTPNVDLDPPAGRRELDPVVNQTPEDLLHTAGIGQHRSD